VGARLREDHFLLVQPEVGFLRECGRTWCMPIPLTREVGARQCTEVVVDERKETVECAVVAVLASD
jgi:hypothetical protein